MHTYAVLVAAILLASSPALADDCAASFPARLADAKRALGERDLYIEQHQAEYRAAAWFADHCRFLSELEITVRKLDDPNTFVCDPKAKGRPKILSAELVANFQFTPNVSQFQGAEFYSPNHACFDQDRTNRVALIGLEALAPIEQLEFLCHADESEKCVRARESIAALRARAAATP
jgi:hypothetical protein